MASRPTGDWMMNVSLANRRVIVMGLGRFGGGVGVTRWLAGQGARVLVTDQAPESELADSVRQLDGLPLRWRLGGHDPADLDACDLLVVSPAVDKVRSEFFQAARERDIPWTSEMNLFLERCPARLVGITGTAGKSTTTAMTGLVLQSEAAGSGLRGRRVFVGGNIGRSLLDDLNAMRPEDVAVLELSSFQLEDAAEVRRSPSIALLTNLRENHLDRHGTMDAYADAKLNIVRFQSRTDVVLVHERETDLRRRVDAVRPRSTVRAFGDEATLATLAGVLRVPGRHNRDNAAGALAIAAELGVGREEALEALRGFTGLPHRLEFVAERDGVRFYNDSKSTTPESARIALEAFDQPVVVLLGGYDKHVSFERLGSVVAARARAAVCYGAVREQIAASVRGANRSATVECVDDLPGAVAAARRLARSGDVVLLSPACASYDQFRNYEQRGDVFRSLVCDTADALRT